LEEAGEGDGTEEVGGEVGGEEGVEVEVGGLQYNVREKGK
jgi:hypothetical protein